MLRILRKFRQSQHTFTAVTGSPDITGSFWTVTDHEPAWSQLKIWRYALNLTYNVFFTKL